MKRYKLYQAPVLSFYSSNLYRDVAQRWRGVNYLFLFLLLLILAIPVTLQMQRHLSVYGDVILIPIVEQLPKVSVKNGEVITPESKPYIAYGHHNKPVIVIDTSGKYTTLKDTDADILVTKEVVYVRKHADNIETINIADHTDLDLTAGAISNWFNQLISHAYWGLYPIIVFGMFVYRAIQVLIYAVFGLIMSKILSAKLSFVSLVRLSVIAVTPVMIISTLLMFFQVVFIHEALMYFLLAMAYLFWGVYANSSTQLAKHEKQ